MCQFLLVEELSPLELRKKLLNCLFLSNAGGCIKSRSVTVLVSSPLDRYLFLSLDYLLSCSFHVFLEKIFVFSWCFFYGGVGGCFLKVSV